MPFLILVVEDNDLNRDMLTRRLQFEDYEVASACDGVEGVEMVESASPDLILMDLSLPRLDGWEATLQIKANPATAHIPVIALTAHAMSEDRDKALLAGCDEFETKPIDWEQLFAKMNTLLIKNAVR